MRFQVTRRVALGVVLATMVGVGQRLLLKADAPQVAAGTWAPAGDLGSMPESTAGVTLADGRLVVAGGRTADGTLVSQIGIYDPATQSWQDGGQLTTARAGHAATALKDGRVLFSGGTTVNGASFDVEVYNPNTHQSVHLGDMSAPRVNHAAAQLLDGSVLIVGGSDGVTVLDHAERFDPDGGETHPLVARLSTAREKFTATTMLDGHVLIAGGQNAGGSLATAEIFDLPSWSFFETGPMPAARSGHVAVLLPNNNQVLIAGGTVNGAPAASAVLYADWRNGFTVAPNGMAAARTGAVGGGLKPYDLGFVAGGGASSGEYFGYATVKTDRDDYWPGETVTITGSGWQPGETVSLKISEDSDTHNDFNYVAVADGNGNIVNAEFAPIENEVFHHFGMRFYLTATGAASTALNTFTDGNATVTGTVRDSLTNAPLAGVSVGCSSGCNGNLTPQTTNAAGFYSLTVNFAGNGPAPITLTASKTGYSNQTTPQFNVTSAGPNTKDSLLVPSATATTTTVSSSLNPSIYGDSVSFTATVSPSTATGSVQFMDGGVGIGAPVTVTGGQAVFATSALLAGAHSITAVFTGTAPFSDSTSGLPLLSQQVNGKALTITATNQNKVYGAVVTPAGTEFTSSGLIGTDTVTSVTLSSPGYAETASVAGSPHAITPSAAVGSGLTNYSIDYLAAGTMTVTARPVTVTADAKTKIYGADDPELTYQLTGGPLVGSDSFSGSLDRAAGQNVGSYAIQQGSLTLGTNYAITFAGANLSITARPIMVTADPKTKTYGNADPALTFQVTPGALVVGDSFSGGLTRAAGETVAGSPYAIQRGTLALSTNYALTFVGADLSITTKAASVTPNAAGKEYGAGDPELTGTLVGFLAGDGVTATYSRTAGETVGGNPYTISAVLTPAGVLSNYNITYNTAPFTITTKAASVTPDGASKEYGTSDPALTGTLSGFLAGDGVTAVYSRTAGETVGGNPYTISAVLAPAGVLSNYDITYSTAPFTITAKAASVTPDAAGKEYGASDPTLTGTLSGFVAGDGVTATYSRTAGETVGGNPYTISAVLNPAAVLSNYAITYNTAPFTITARPVTVTADPKTKTYGDPDPALTYQVTTGTLVSGDAFSGELTRVAGETVAASPYAIQQGTLALGDNYVLTFAGANLAITARPVTVTVDPKSKTYGDADPALTYQVTTGTLVSGDAFSGALTRVAGETVAASPYAIQQGTLVLSDNYALTFAGANLAITARPMTVTAYNASKTYGQPTPSFGYSAPGLLPGDTLSGPAVYAFNGSPTVPTNAGSYVLSVNGLSNTNYIITFATGTYTIHKATPVITWSNPADITYSVALSATQLNASADVPGSFVYTPPSGTVLNVGPGQTLHVAFTPTDTGNYNDAAKDVQINVAAWTAQGFHQPIGIPNSFFTQAPTPSLLTMPSGSAAWNTAKGGSTVPLKFNVFAGGSEVTSTANFIFGVRPMNCLSGVGTEEDIDLVTTGSTTFRYDGVAGSGGQFIQNWKTPASKIDQCFRVEVTLPDSSMLYTFVKLKK